MDHNTLVSIGIYSLLVALVAVTVFFFGYIATWLFFLDGVQIESRHPRVEQSAWIVRSALIAVMIVGAIFGIIVLGVSFFVH
jgi:hypothetical protein